MSLILDCLHEVFDVFLVHFRDLTALLVWILLHLLLHLEYVN